MEYAENSKEDSLISAFRARIEGLLGACAQVCAAEGADFRRFEVTQSPFSMQMLVDGGVAVSLPCARMTRANVQAEVRPSQIRQDIQGRHHGGLKVNRAWINAGRLDSPACWTDLDDANDSKWYVGAEGDKSIQVSHDLIRGWLHYSGPRPIW